MIIAQKKHISLFKVFLYSLSLVTIISFLVLKPSFHLSLTGDDYLGLWRYNGHLSGREGGNWNAFSYFLSDYGPQDTFTFLIHSFFGFNPLPYFIASFLLRLIAALSFIPLVLLLSGNPYVASFTAVLFSVSTTGLETTDWSFNMPSYLAICFMNMFLYFYTQQKQRFASVFTSAVLFLLAIISQPIRLMFLPLVVLLVEVHRVRATRSPEQLKSSLQKVVVYVVITILLLATTHIGRSAGGLADPSTDKSVITKLADAYVTPLATALSNGNYIVILNPIGQLGNVLVPFTLTPQSLEIISNKAAIGLSALSYTIFMVCILLLVKRHRFIFSLSGFCWTVFSFVSLKLVPEYPLNTSSFLPYLYGGYAVIFFFALYIRSNKQKESIRLMLLLSGALIFGSYLIPWLRTPTQIYITTGRYLIVAGAGAALFYTSVLIHLAGNKIMAFGFMSLIVLMNVVGSTHYLSYLHAVRNREMTERIRSSVPYIPTMGRSDIPTVVYFESDNDQILQHTLMFGFPVIMSFRFNFTDIWNTAYTTSWGEVQASVKDGSGLARFGTIKTLPVPLSHVYSFKLERGNLYDTTEETRYKLEQELLQTN